MRLRRGVIAGTVTALLGAAIAVTVVEEPVQPPAVIAEALDEVTAMTVAQSQDARVEVLNQRTPTRVVWANPGGTLTAQLHTVPVRVFKDGGWRPVDQTLERRPDGTVEPKAAVGELVLSGGGDDAPLAEMTSEGRRFSVRWPAPLPKPVLDGATATYPEVLPGVDLRMHAGRAGYRQHLVVKTPAAAKNPALRAIRMTVDAGGLRVRAEKSGALSAVDDKGEVVFSSPPAVMWDAERRTKRVGVALGKGTMDITPDLEFLADPATAFPVTIDPDWTPNKHGWTSVLSGHPNDTYWNSSGDGETAQVGQCYDVGYCYGIKEAWSYFQWDTSALNGRTLHSATFNTAIRSSPKCVNKTHRFYRATGAVGTGTTWNNKPGGTLLTDFTAEGVHTNCAGWKGVGIGVPTGHISTTGFSTFLITAKDSWDQEAWRKYDPASTTLTINYNTAPHAPVELHTDPPLPPPCRWCEGVSYYGADSIRVKARMSDPDGDQVNANWRIFRNGVSGETGWGGFLPSGSLHDLQLGIGDTENGKVISFGANAGDGRAGSGWVDWSGRFVADRTGIDRAPTVSAKVYTEDNRWHGGAGVADTFTFGPNWVDTSRTNDIDHYLYDWNGEPATKVEADALGGKATIELTPPGDGPQTLFVRSVDRAGHRSPVEEHRFYVRAGNGALAQYSFEGNARDTAFLGDRHASLHGGAGYTAQGAVGSAAVLGGAPAHLTAATAVRTDGPFSVSAWVKLSRLPEAGHTFSALSQDGAVVSGFMLGYRNVDGGQWEIYSPSADSSTRPADEGVRVNRPVALNTWTHVAAVFDPTKATMALYLNGALVETAPRTKGFNATGAFAVGRSLWNGAPTNHWPGAIDEVQVHDRVLSTAEIAAAVSTSGVQLAHWKLDDGKGTTARNAVEGGIDGVLENGATFTTAGAVAGGLRLDGVDDAMSTPGPVLRTDQSFTVAAQVKLDRFDTGTYTVLSQDGTRFCGFCLQYQNGRWVFVFADSDVDTPAAYYFAGVTAVPKESDFTHLVGTYDADTDKLRLYVDGIQVGQTTRAVSWNATGPLRIGRALIRGAMSQHLPGTVDEVRVLSRAVTLDEVRGLLSRDGVSAGQWRLDDNATEANGRTNLDGTPSATVDWTAGQTDTPNPDDLAARLDGTSAHLAVPGVINTDESFSVAAWARLDRIGGHPAVISQDGTNVSAFMLRAWPNGKWAFRAQDADVHNSAGGEAVSGTTAQPGVWTHLVGVYRKDLQRLELYVNGVLAGSAPHTKGFRATGLMEIGRAKWNGAATDYFPGAIDDVSVYSRPLYAAEITTMAGRDLSLGHNWTMDEGTGTTSGDAAGARPAALTGGAAFTPGRVGNAVRFDGGDDVVATQAVDVRTDASFTVTAWVKLEGNDCDLDTTSRCVRSAVALDSGGTSPSSKFRLGHVVDDQGHDGNWVFELPELDGSITDAAISVRPDHLNRWVHLTGVYDAGAKAIYLYVNGDYSDDGTLVGPWHGAGGLTIGRGQKAGRAEGFWHGSVDDVRLYTGALDDDRVSALVAAYPPVDAAATMPVADRGHWKFNEGSGTTAADASGGRTMTLHGAAGWNGGRDAGSLWLDGNGGHAETAATAFDTTASFSVSAWVALTDSTKYATVFGQDGNVVSTFYLQYDATARKWGAVVPRTDAADPELDQVLSLEPALLNAWTHLTVVYHAQSTQLRLYVNGSLSGVKTAIVPEASTGPLSVGRCKWNRVKACYFPKGIDDVRAFGKALSDGEVRRLHDDAPAVPHGTWRFDDGTVTDSSWRANPTTASGPVTYPQGVSGTGLGLDGVSASATATHAGIPMRDSFTVSAWAKLTRGDKVATVVGQDGSRQSGFTIQYRPSVNRWMFGAATHDADNVPTVYAASTNPPALNRWTHLAAVYDQPARQLRIYVDGHLAGTRGNVLLWQAHGGFTIGRGKVNGLAAEFFPGAVDEVTTDLGVVRDHDITAQASRPTPSGGHFGRFVDAGGDHRSVNATSGFWDQFAPMPDRYRYEGPLGMLLDAERPGTHRLYSCLAGADSFTSTAADCGGAAKLADLGWAYTQPPAGVSTVPLHACRFGQERADSADPACEGGTVDGVIGHLVAYAPLVRYIDARRADHAITTGGLAPSYRREGTLGLLARSTAEPGIQTLQSCLSGTDRFLSTDPACGGKTVVNTVGGIWTEPPPGLASRAIYQCQTSPSNRFESTDPACEGRTALGRLGYVLTAVPAPRT